MNPIKSLGVAALAAMIGLAACDDAAPASATIAPAGKAGGPAQTTTAAVAGVPDAGTAAIVPVYAYNPLVKRDPFRSYIEVQKGAEPADGNICGEPLCQWDLEQLTLVAVVSGDSNPIAMVEDPANVGHIIRRSTKIGKQGGQITQILRDCVIVTEYWTGPDGKHQPNAVKICIKQDSASASLVQATDLLQKQLP